MIPVLLAEASIPSGGWIAVLLGIGTAVGGAVTWFIEHYRMLAEIKKLNVEAIKTAGETLEKVQAVRRTYFDLTAQLAASTTSLLDAVTAGTAEEIEAIRNNVCSIFLDKAVLAFVDWMEWASLACPSNEDRFDLVSHQIDHELGLFANWLSILNNPLLLLGQRQTSPATISPVRLHQLHSIAHRLKGHDRTMAHETFTTALERISHAGQQQHATPEQIQAFLARRPPQSPPPLQLPNA